MIFFEFVQSEIAAYDAAHPVTASEKEQQTFSQNLDDCGEY